MEILFGYFAGVLTLINPCVVPVLPIALASSLSAHRLGPVALVAGMSLAFSVFGITISAIGPAIGISPETIATAGAVLMILFGSVLLVPQLNTRFALATSGFSSSADSQINTLNMNGLWGQFLGGALLGAVWSPCIGPTLGGAISLASQGNSLAWAASIMVAFSAGISTVILALAYGAREALRTRQDMMRKFAAIAKPVMGVTFLLVGLMIFFKWHHVIELWLLERMPDWLLEWSVTF